VIHPFHPNANLHGSCERTCDLCRYDDAVRGRAVLKHLEVIHRESHAACRRTEQSELEVPLRSVSVVLCLCGILGQNAVE
jgi:hypothetical protein